jgi:nicotinamidase-related amidase
MLENDLLVVVDVQNGFVNADSCHVVEPIRAFAESWIHHGGQVVATKFINEIGSPWEVLTHWTRLQKSPETDLHPTVRSLFESSKQIRVVEKNIYSSLTEEVAEIVRSTSVKRALICGIDTDACVLKTAVDFFESGIVPIVLTDLCASHAGPEIHDAGLLLIGRFIGRDQLVDSQSVLSSEH